MPKHPTAIAAEAELKKTLERLDREFQEEDRIIDSSYQFDFKLLYERIGIARTQKQIEASYMSDKERLKSKYSSEREHAIKLSKIPCVELSAKKPEKLEAGTYFLYVIRLANNGNGPANDLEFSIKGELKGDTSISIPSLDESETETMELSLLPTAPGKVRYSMLLTYKDILGREYNQGGEKWFDVAKQSDGQAPTYLIKDSVVDAKSTYVDESLHISRTHVDNSVNIDARDAILQRSPIAIKKK